MSGAFDARAATLIHRVMTGKGGMGNYAQPSGADMSNLSLEEREAYAKVHAHDKGSSTGRGYVYLVICTRPRADN